jgi:hypothetical protein
MFKDKIQQVQSAVTVTLNDAYFGPDVPPPAPRNMMRPGGTDARPRRSAHAARCRSWGWNTTASGAANFRRTSSS